MASSPDWKKLYLEERERRIQVQERRKQAQERWEQAKEQEQAEERRIQDQEIWKQLKELWEQEKERRRQEEGRPKQTEHELKQENEHKRRTTFMEFLCHCHNLFCHSLECISGRFAEPMYYGESCLKCTVEDPGCEEEFMLGDGIMFSEHGNTFNETRDRLAGIDRSGSPYRNPNQFCVYRVDGDADSLLLPVQRKSPHELSVENLRVGLRPMELWDEVVNRDTIPTDPVEKLQYNAELLSTSALVPLYDIMIGEGRAHAMLANGFVRVLLYVSHDDPVTLNYHLCEPNREIVGDLQSLQQPMTSIARELCLCLMSLHSPTRSQEWRNSARSQARIWEINFDRARSLIPNEEFQKVPQFDNVNLNPGPTPLDHNPLSALGFSMADFQVSTSSSTSCATTDAQFCTQRCLLSLKNREALDDACPNVGLHRQSDNGCKHHPTTSEDLLLSLKTQLDENIDRCTPTGQWGAYGAPFKLTCLQYGYTVIGKGTTSDLWKEVSREVQVYQILRKAQGSTVPVFLGTIDLAKSYFLYRAGEIRHRLVMGWGGECSATMELTRSLRREIQRLDKELQSFGIDHGDFQYDNILWCEELKRALIIDFHRSTLKYVPPFQRNQPVKRRPADFRKEKGNAKCLRVRKLETNLDRWNTP
ncbi:hypothetical protein MYU51_001499 [Penicillium brevicompactum]